MARLTKAEIQQVRSAILTEITERPPRIAVIGVSGTGKSSTINAMFKTDLRISHTTACTKEFQATSLEMRVKRGVAQDERVSLVVVDAPGLGEDIARDPGYLEMYAEHLPLCDVILWLMTARNRAISLDQQYLGILQQYTGRMVFGINQVDLVHPMDWPGSLPIPSLEMERNITEIVRDRSERLARTIGAMPPVVAISAERGYNLEALYGALIAAIPENRRFIFDFLKDFSYRDFVPQQSNGGNRV